MASQAKLKLEVYYKEQPPNDFLEEFRVLVASHPGIELSSTRCILDSCQSTSSSSSSVTGQVTASTAEKSKKGPCGYDPPELNGPNACPYCHLSPCVVDRPPSWVRGSSAPSLANNSKRYSLYRKFWTFLNQLGVWNHPEYAHYKYTRTSVLDTRDVLPACVVREVRGRFPNPPGVPYTDFQPSSHI